MILQRGKGRGFFWMGGEVGVWGRLRFGGGEGMMGMGSERETVSLV
jgi:hypothetical protein